MNSEQYVNPYTQPAHIQWVARGMCSSISLRKVWCDHADGHSGDYHSWGVAEHSLTEHPRDLGTHFDAARTNRAQR